MTVNNYMTKQEFVYDEIKNRILRNDYHQGMLLTERMMCNELGVSRTPVREAFMRLDSSGLVRMVPRQGATVTNLSVDKLVELYELREALEKMAIKLFMARTGDDRVVPLLECMDRQKELVETNNFAKFIDYDIAFHRHIIEGSRNKRFAEDLADVYDLINMVYPIVSHKVLLEESIAQHDRIVEAISNGDVSKAEDAMTEHINFIKNAQIAAIMGTLSEFKLKL